MVVKITIDLSGLENLEASLQGMDNEYIVADGVEYGVFVEYGYTRPNGDKVPGRPAAVPAFETTTGELPEAVEAAMGQGVRLHDVFRATAFNMAAHWQDRIRMQNAIDTGNYINSVGYKT